MLRDSGRRNYPIRLKFGRNVYAKLAVYFLMYNVQIEHALGYTKVSQYIMAYGGKFLKNNLNVIIVPKI